MAGGKNNPLPVSLSAECRKAASLYASFASPVNGLDKIIPADVLRRAKGFAFLTVIKAGFVFSARAGTGVVIARLSDGNWSAPSAIGTAGAGFGLQVGAEMAEFIIILNSKAAVSSFMAAGSLTLGGNMSVAAGPVGRNLEGTGTLSSKGGLAAMYSYSRTKGLFGGASVEGSVIVERSDANAKAYGFAVTAKQLLNGSVDVPPFANTLIDTISRRSGNATNWVASEDEDDPNSDFVRPRMDRGYSFGTQYARGGVDGQSPSKTKFPSLPGKYGEARERSSSTASLHFKKYVGDSGRSRSGSTPLPVDIRREGESGHERSPFGAEAAVGPLSTNETKFEHHFTDNASSSEDEVDGERQYSALDKTNRGGPISSSDLPGKEMASHTSYRSRSGSGSNAKLTKSRSGSGGSGLREMANAMDWDGFTSKLSDSESTTDMARGGSNKAIMTLSSASPRSSFDSLDDPSADNRYSPAGHNEGEMHSRNDPSFQDDGAVQGVMGSRSRSSSLLGKFSPFSKKTPNMNSHNDRQFNKDLRQTSFLEDEDLFDHGLNNGREIVMPNQANQSLGKTRSARPWDSEIDDLMSFSSIPVKSKPQGGQVGLSRTLNLNSLENGLSDSIALVGGGGKGVDPSSRTRSGSGPGLGSAVALYDFPGVETSDLAFKKGELITILKKDDEEWWNGRIKLREGLFPRNFVEEL